ncbi:MAG TPA: hypothetical protein VHZ51_09560 [Ktedonobacteraceae bacterium]|nr:hypothetical protein [Ktedonobacteraceae bacterium]
MQHDGTTFTWPNAPAGQPNNVATAGQIISFSGSGSSLAFVGSGTFGIQSGIATVTYTDGSTQQLNLSLADWYANSAASGGDIVATSANWNTPPGSTLGSHAVSIYYTAVPLQSGKTIRYVTLPTDNNMHLFAMTIVH